MSRYLTPQGASPRSFTQKVNELELQRPQAKRLTLSSVIRQMDALKANLARIDMRLSKAEAHGEAVKAGKLLEIQAKSRAQFISLSAEYIRLGGGMIKQEG